MTTLNTELAEDGIKLTFPSGYNAGNIAYDLDSRSYHFEAPQRPDLNGPSRNCLEAAQFDALAWAAEVNQFGAYDPIGNI